MERSSAQFFWVIKIGILGYEDAWFLQNGLKKAKQEGTLADTLILLQHPPTITLGRKGSEENLLVSEEELKKKGIDIFFSDRGGDVTFHGPGQLVGYPILNLREYGFSVGKYMRLLEKVIIQSLMEIGITGITTPPLVGVWVDARKIASFGVRVNKGVTTHGFALNVTNDLTPFQFINPCGMRDLKITSVSKVLGKEVNFENVEDIVTKNFSQVFKIKVKEVITLCSL